jgi:hypothetical protein
VDRWEADDTEKENEMKHGKRKETQQTIPTLVSIVDMASPYLPLSDVLY